MSKLEELPPAERYAAPDWAGGATDLHCPLCDYNLRGLNEPRCPECGYSFSWYDLTKPERISRAYLFESRPAWNLKSFWQTLVGGLRPMQFWTSLKPVMPSRSGRLFAYWLLCAAIGLLGALAPYVALWIRITYGSRSYPPSWIGYVVDVIGPGYIVWWAWGCAWPWLTYLSLMIFRVSKRRAKVKPIHVQRAVIYSGDVLVWTALCLIVFFTLSAVMSREMDEGPAGPAVRVFMAAGALLTVFRLGMAFQHYLRFRYAWTIVILSQMIVGLIGVALLPDDGLYLWAWSVWFRMMRGH